MGFLHKELVNKRPWASTGLALPKVETQRSQKRKVAKVKLQKVVKAKGRKIIGLPKLSFKGRKSERSNKVKLEKVET